MNITADIKYDEASVIEFNLPAQVDGEPTPYYDAVIGMRIVELQNIGQFILVNPKETGDGVKKIKACKGYSLEYEFTFKKLSLANATYNFWNPVTPDSTLLGIILELMPSWSVGSIDNNLVGKYRTFEVSDENLYNFIKGTIQTSYNCIFDFDTYHRRIKIIHGALGDKIAVWTTFQPNNGVRFIIVDSVRTNDDLCADLKAFDGSIHNAPPSFRFSLLIKKRPT